MKILQVIPYFVPAWGYGGPVVVAYHLSKELVKRGHQVTVYTTDALDSKSRIKSSSLPTLELDGINVRYFKNLSNRLAWYQNVWLSPGMLPAMRAEVKTFDIIHIHEFRTVQSILAYHYARKYGVPYVLQAHGAMLYFSNKRVIKRVFDMLFGYRMLRDASQVIALSKTEAEQSKEMGVDESRIEVVPNGVDLSEYSNLPERGMFRRKYGIGDDEKIILFLGRIHKDKGVDLLVEAFAGLVTELEHVKLVIAGPDDGYLRPLKESIVSLGIEADVLFTGLILGQDKLAAYTDADVFFSYSAHLSPVITFLESWACGTPIVTTSKVDLIVGRQEVHNVAGYIVEHSREGVRDALVKILSDEGLRRRLGDGGKKLVQERFSWSQVVNKVEDIYLNIVAEQKAK